MKRVKGDSNAFLRDFVPGLSEMRPALRKGVSKAFESAFLKDLTSDHVMMKLPKLIKGLDKDAKTYLQNLSEAAGKVCVEDGLDKTFGVPCEKWRYRAVANFLLLRAIVPSLNNPDGYLNSRRLEQMRAEQGEKFDSLSEGQKTRKLGLEAQKRANYFSNPMSLENAKGDIDKDAYDTAKKRLQFDTVILEKIEEALK